MTDCYIVHHATTGEILFQGFCGAPTAEDPAPHLKMATDPHHVAIIAEPGIVYDDTKHAIDVATGKRIDKTPPSAEAQHAEALRLLRARRNQLLTLSDRAVTPDRWEAMSEDERAEHRAYRQALRDMPATTADPANPVWPTQPAKR